MLGLEDNQICCWPEVLRLAGLPQLRRLHLSGNKISSITLPQHHIAPAALLAAEPPPAALQEAQQQQQQHVSQQPPFANLEALLLGNCCLSHWSDIDALNSLPRLTELRLIGNPLFAVEGSGAGAGRRFEVRPGGGANRRTLAAARLHRQVRVPKVDDSGV